MQNIDIPNFHASTGESIVRACVTSIAGLNPFTGMLANAYFQHMDDQRWRYVEKFFEDFSKNVEIHIDEILELDDRTDPDEILHLMLTAINNVEFEYQEARRTKYAELFVNSVLLGNQISFDEKRVFFQLFSELSEADVTLLGKFFSNSQYMIDLEDFRKFGLSEGFRLEEVVPLVVRLESRGLITEIYKAKKITRWDGSIDNFDSVWRNKIYTLTPIGIKFGMFLKGKQ